MKQKAELNLPEEVSVYNNEKIIIETNDEFEAYMTIKQIQDLKEKAQFGLHHPNNEAIIEACNYMLDLRFS